ncbi:LysE family translocator [Paludibacterium denitrificans]|uniref:LysE family translocator n=1 Tax=Paludibacterium denitrificans TaxID=2675226 RepID=UPI0028ABFDA5|nr:LysE family transporter [Paludibacterium denitrificans]
MWRGASQPLAIDNASEATRRGSVGKALLLGLGTQLSNPKAAIVYASIFATFLPHGTTLPLSLAIVALVFVIESSWYTLVALTLSAEKARQSYLRAKTWIDHLTGGVMVLLGLKLASSAHVG